MLRLHLSDKISVLKPKELETEIEKYSDLLKNVQKGEDNYLESLGWLNVNEWAGEEVLKIVENLAAEIRSKADAFVIIGVGGSNNATRAVIKAITPEGRPEILYAGNTLSAHAINSLLKKLDDKKSIYINCIAKNFETLEPGASFRILRRYLTERYGKKEAAKRILCTGTVGSNLEDICRQENYTFLPFPDNIGGRYTAMSYVHLVPMAVAGINVQELVSGAKDMEKNLRTSSSSDNIALKYAVLRNLFYSKGYFVELLSSFEPQLKYFHKWWEQMFAESEGKANRGLLPISCEFTEELHSLGQFIQEGTPILFETFLDISEQQDSLIIEPDQVADGFDYLNGKDLWDVNKASFHATVTAHSKKLPCIIIEIDKLDAYHFGQMFYFFAFSCYLSSRILGINPFNQPGVEAYKTKMFEILGKPQD